MGLSDVAGVFSRFFIVGFFLPAFFGLLAVAELGSDALRPEGYERYSAATEILILGGAGLLVGLFMLGLHRPILRLFEGYPLVRLGLAGPLVRLQQRTYDRLARAKAEGSAGADEATRSRAMRAWLHLDRFFPDGRDRLLPTRFGNAMRAAEDYAYSRWGLDSIPFWAHVEPLLNEQERALHENARSDIAFFLNTALTATIAGSVLLVDEIVNTPVDPLWSWVYLLAFVLAYVIYRFSIDAAQRWGVEIKASLDLHRLEVYDRLGLRRPSSFSDERTAVAPALNRFFLYGMKLPDQLYAKGGDP